MESTLLAFLSTLLKTYFISTRCIVVISDNSMSLEIPVLNISFVNLRINLSPNETKFDTLFNHFGCQDFLVFGNKPVSTFKEIEREIKLTKERFPERRYVFLPNEEITDLDLLKIFDTAAIDFVSDLLVIKKNNCDVTKQNQFKKIINECVYFVWTHHYKGNGIKNQPYLLDTWFSKNKSFSSNTYLFPNKLRHQEGRELKFATFQYEPYTIVEPLGDNKYHFMGSEMKSAVTFAKYLDMTFVPVVNENDYWGEVFDNWTGTGLMGNIAMDNADIGAGALYTWESVYPYLELSKPTVRTGITCLVPAPTLSAGWLTPIYAFSASTWIAVGFSFFAIVLINFLTQSSFYQKSGHSGQETSRLGMISKAFLLVGKPIVLQNVTPNEMINERLGRFIMGLIFLMSMVLSATYDSGFASVMTIPRYENPIDTVGDFVASGINWGAQADAWITSIGESEEESYKKIVSRFKILTENQLREKSLTGSFAFSLERLPEGDFAIGNYIQNDVIANYHLMQDDFYWEYCVIMARRNSILLPLLDDFILRVFEAGLISVWQNEAATKYMNQYVQKAVKYLLHKKERTIVKLKILHVEGAFGILLLGNLLGFIVFCFEILMKNMSKRHLNN